ncbi:TonB-linked SusC/RagA family outer membrane protein [Pedobacter africanus]|uniref:TonB-linked SusC/RagA family outer membrane protein n=1 Tax=Pedobacter africanus TaxID=151894 RepID=A0ACC6L4W9_9SPHI|nr:TonB-dependent receptor [Pedobacter africanus]MDR6786412.1 TonB-linked SusC/RagA family outer membrane protein [Pedobacter africanus]
MKRISTKLVVLTFLCFLFTNVAQAQDITVKGVVSDETDKLPLPGVSVLVKGTRTGTTTDASGRYAISAPANATLVFSYLGYLSREISVNNQADLNISLASSSQELEQVVVVGYGTQKKKDLTGSVAQVKGEELTRQPVQTATQALQGKIAGVQIISSGEPNTSPTVRLRGTGTMLGGANPLYVVDGVFTEDIKNINNADILSVDVLKDASASAIYGMRAANGVILITTKKGKAGENVFTYDGNIGFREANNLVDMAGSNQYTGYLNEANKYYGSGSDLITPSMLTGANTDWYDAILQKGLITTQNLSLSGGSDKVTYFLSAGLLSDEGIQKGNKYDRFTLRVNNEYTLTKKLKFSNMLSYTNGKAKGAQLDAFGNAYRAAPIIASKVGDLYGNTSLFGNVSNPLLSLDKVNNTARQNRIQGNFALDYKPIEGLTLRSAMGLDLDYLKSTDYGYRYLPDGSTFLVPGGNQSRANSTLKLTKNDTFRWIWDNTATYTKTIEKHNFTLLAGVTAEGYKFNEFVGNARDIPANQDQWYLDAGSAGTQSVANTGDKYNRYSYLTRLNYGYDSRYLLTASFRADATSKFGKMSQWEYFPSLGLAWNISNESFMTDQKVFSNLKIRGSYGQMGNDNIKSSLYIPIAIINRPYPIDGAPIQGIRFEDTVDNLLRWEITTGYDAGLDFGFLNNRLSGTIDYYHKKTDNALIYVGIPAILGDPDGKALTNASTISNKGLELSLGWADELNESFKYGISGNIAYNKNTIEKLNGGQPLFGDNIANYQITKSDNGQAIGSYFLLEKIGIFQNQAQIDASAQKDARAGDIIYRDISGPNGTPDGKIDNNDRAYFGSYQPKFTYGLNGNLSYKNFDLNFGFFGTQGGKIYNAKKAARGVSQLTDNVEASVVKNRWTPNNPNNNVPRATIGALPASTYFVEKGDYLRLNNLTVGYTLPKALLKKAHISNVRFFLTAQNLFTITSYSGFTPELQPSIPGAKEENANLNQGVDLNSYPSTRTFAFGVNVGF